MNSKIFLNTKFLILPNSNTTSIEILSELIRKFGGEIIEDLEDLDKNTVILINDSYIGDSGSLIQQDLFRRECHVNFTTLEDFVHANELQIVRVSCVSRWIKQGAFQILGEDLVSIISDTGEEHGSQTSTDNSITDIIIDENVPDSEAETEGNIELESFEDVENKNSMQYEHINEPLIESSYINLGKNDVLIKALNLLAKKYRLKGDQFRARSYTLAKASIEKCPYKIESGAQAQRELTNIGLSIAKKIDIILKTGILPGLEEVNLVERKLDYFTNCHAVGSYKAKRWELFKLSSFSDVVTRFPDDFITDWTMLFGWSYYEDWSKRISREECECHLKIVKDTLKTIDPSCHVELQGSYVRGSETCGDIDLLFYKQYCDDTKEIGIIFEKLVRLLFRKGFIQCSLMLTSKLQETFKDILRERFQKCGLKYPSGSSLFASDINKKYYLGTKLPTSVYKARDEPPLLKLKECDKYMSLSSSRKNENPCRRLDFFCCKWSEIGAARMQWTGSGEFNRWIRLLADKHGLKLSQHGLFTREGELLESYDERKIFQLLHVDYVKPELRSEGLWQQDETKGMIKK